MSTAEQGVINNDRITNTATDDPLISNITITGFTAADNEGTVQCHEFIGGSVQGMATVSIGK